MLDLQTRGKIEWMLTVYEWKSPGCLPLVETEEVVEVTESGLSLRLQIVRSSLL